MDFKLVTSEIINVLNRSGDQELDDLFKMVGKMHSDLDSKTFSSYLMEMVGYRTGRPPGSWFRRPGS